MIEKAKGIIWDWNGTLLNDTQLCVNTMNGLLQKRNLNLLTETAYKEVFSFPVKSYYQKIGFDFTIEPFEIPALEFIDIYNAKVHECDLQPDAFQILKYFNSLDISQFVLSAMEQNALEACLKNSGIDHFFRVVSGLDNHFAASKTENGKRLISENGLDPSELVLIGDTVHDYEVASELGCNCILIADGHQSKQVLQKTGAVVLDKLSMLLG